RWGANDEELRSHAAELVAMGPDVILGGAATGTRAVQRATRTIPIVFAFVPDPVALGFVTSVARPGGNITGIFLRQIELTVNRLQLGKDAFPGMQAATVFWDRISADQWEAARDASTKLGLPVAGIELREQPYDYDRALAQATPDYPKNLLVLVSPFFFRDRARLAELARRNRVTSMFGFREWVEEGGLLSYGPSIAGMYQRAAEYVDRIAKGAKPTDL